MLLFERHLERRIESELVVYFDQIIAQFARGAGGALVVPDVLAVPRFVQPLSGLFWQLQTKDAVLRSRSLWDGDLPLPGDELADGVVHRHRIIGQAGAELLALERSVTTGAPWQCVCSSRGRNRYLRDRRRPPGHSPPICCPTSVSLRRFSSRRRSGRACSQWSRKRLAAIREGNGTRLGTKFPREVQPLAAEVDALLEAREREAERARAQARAADLAHGLKSPLQVLTGDVERLRQKGEADTAADIEQVATTMRRHVERELTRARMKSGVSTARAPVREVIDRVLAVVMRTPGRSSRLDSRVRTAAPGAHRCR